MVQTSSSRTSFMSDPDSGACRSSGGEGGGEGGGGGDVSCPSSWGIPSSSPSLSLLLQVPGVHAVGGSEALAGGAGLVEEGAEATVVFLDTRIMDNGTGPWEGGGAREGGAVGPGRAAGAVNPGSLGCSGLAALRCQAAGGALSGRRRCCSMQASLLLSSRSRDPGPRRLALLAGAGAVAAAAVGEAGGREGARVPGAASWLLVGPLPLLGVL